MTAETTMPGEHIDQPVDYPAEWLPPVNLLSGDIRYLLEEYADRKVRQSLVVEYVDSLRERIQPNFYSVQSGQYAQEQVLSRLFLDSIALTARHQKYHSDSKKMGRRAPETFDDLRMLLATKRDMKLNLADYVRFNPDKPSGILFNNLWSMMNHSRRLIYNDDVTMEKSRLSNARELFGLLAENKVVLALQENEWPLANHSTIDQDSGGADVVIPVGHKMNSAVLLQVKSRDFEGSAFQIHPNHRTHKVVVPMNLRDNNPFRLSTYDAHMLNEFIHNAPRVKLPLAA
jgi:hypothetical protein